MDKLNKYDYEVIQYIYDNNNKEALFKLDDESLRESQYYQKLVQNIINHSK